MTKSKAAFLFASQTLGKQKLFLWTFTFRELLAVKEHTEALEPFADSAGAGMASVARAPCF
jgi:hypothetical protein